VLLEIELEVRIPQSSYSETAGTLPGGSFGDGPPNSESNSETLLDYGSTKQSCQRVEGHINGTSSMVCNATVRILTKASSAEQATKREEVR
jgi:hypothetical protein